MKNSDSFKWLVCLFSLFAYLEAGKVVHTSNTAYLLSFEENKCDVTLSSIAGILPASGYVDLQVECRNDSSSAKQVRLDFEASSAMNHNWRQNRALEKTQTFRLDLPAQRTVMYRIQVPVARMQDSNYRSGFETDLRCGGIIGKETTYASIDSRFHFVLDNTLFSEATIKGRSDSYLKKREVSVADLPMDFEVIAGYSFLVITAEEWTSISSGQRNMLKSWMHQGGALYFLYEANNLTQVEQVVFKSFGVQPVDASITRADFRDVLFASYNMGSVGLLSKDGFEKSLDTIEKTSLSRRGKANRPIELEWTNPSLHFWLIDHLKDDYQEGDWNLPDLLGSKSFGVELLSLFIIVFVIMVGPVNFFIYAKPGNRHRLFITTPIIAGVSSILLVGFIILSEGFGGKGVQRVHIEIDADNNRGFVMQQQFSRTGVLLNNGFTIDPSYEVYQVPIRESRWARVMHDGQGSDEYYRYSQTADGKLRLQGSFFSSRSEQAHLIRGSKVTHEKVKFIEESGAWTATSYCANVLEEVFMRSADGKFWYGKQLTSGVPVTLKQILEEEYQAGADLLASRFNGGYKDQLDKLLQRKQSYVALSSEMPGLATLTSIRWQSCETILTGSF